MGGRWETEEEKVKGLAKGHTCLNNRHGQQCGDGQKGGVKGWVGAGKGKENGDICNNVTKIKRKKSVREKSMSAIAGCGKYF